MKDSGRDVQMRFRCLAGVPNYAERRSSADVKNAGLFNPDSGRRACSASLDPVQIYPCQVPL